MAVKMTDEIRSAKAKLIAYFLHTAVSLPLQLPSVSSHAVTVSEETCTRRYNACKIYTPASSSKNRRLAQGAFGK
jgi:hypothetical protein